MSKTIKFLAATPIWASLDIARTAAFHDAKLGFTTPYSTPEGYAVLHKGDVALH